MSGRSTNDIQRDLDQRANIVGVEVSAINMEVGLEIINLWIKRAEPNYICVTPAHGIMECQRDTSLKSVFNNSGMTTPDGMAIVWLLRFLGHRHVDRVYGPDLLLKACQKSIETGWKHFFYGGAPGVAEKLAKNLQERFLGLQIAGIYCPPFRPLTPEEDLQMIAEINRARPDIVWVGISTPKQELDGGAYWVSLCPCSRWCGAAFDFLSGTKKQAPRWMQRSGLEWLFRLASEPRRLWRRYIEYPYFVLLVTTQMLGFKKYPTIGKHPLK
jgi:N-acetylglucosaminyldiphosphoundecaprenol N-acetyl-beta-D-mannosaminyltransferase